jgi:hypothetical protein
MQSRFAHLFSRRMLVVGTLATGLVLSVAVLAAGKAASKDKAPAGKEQQASSEEAAPASNGERVHIYVQTVPPRKAMVRWGHKTLGTIPVPRPMVVERPRDSGPLDLVIRAAGFLPVHTRAYTFSDSRVAVKLTPPSEKNKLFGYKQEPAPNPDAGVPAPAPAGATAESRPVSQP